MVQGMISRSASTLLPLLVVAACEPVIPRPADEPPWLGVATSPQIDAFMDSAAVADTHAIVRVELRFRYPAPQRMSADSTLYAESRTVVDIDCAGRRGRTLDLRLVPADGSKPASLPLEPDDARWDSFESHSLSTYFLAACIRMGRVIGRLAPNKRLKLAARVD
jgi:hypothetical protein